MTDTASETGGDGNPILDPTDPNAGDGNYHVVHLAPEASEPPDEPDADAKA